MKAKLRCQIGVLCSQDQKSGNIIHLLPTVLGVLPSVFRSISANNLPNSNRWYILSRSEGSILELLRILSLSKAVY